MSAPSVPEVVAGKRAIIFDLFHTLTSLESTWGGSRPLTHAMLGVTREAWDRQLHEHSQERLTGVQTNAYEIVGRMARAIDPAITDDLVRRATDNRIARFAGALIQMPVPVQETVRVLRKSGKKIGLISNADVMEMAAWSQCPIHDQFDSTLFSCQVGWAKPDARIYLQCLEELGVSSAEAVFVGDGGSNELEGAKAVGLTTVMITGIIRNIWPERISERRAHADFLIEELSEILPTARQTPPAPQ